MLKPILHYHYNFILSLLVLIIGLSICMGCTVGGNKDLTISGQNVDEKKTDPISINPQ